MKANCNKSHILKSKNYKPSAVEAGNVTIVNSEKNDSKEVSFDEKIKI